MQQMIGSYIDPSTGTYISQRSRTYGVEETCLDVVGNREGVNPFYLTRYIRNHPSLNGIFSVGDPPVATKQFVDFPTGLAPEIPDPQTQFAEFTLVDFNNYAYEILANTNPSLPHVSMPQFIAEMKDIPSLTQGWGRSLLKSAAQGHLSWRWALKPMMSDIQKLANFHDAVNQRLKELQAMQDGKPLRKKCRLGKYRYATPRESVWLHSEGALLTGWRQTIYTSEVWGSCEWKLAPNSPYLLAKVSNRQLGAEVRKLLLGMTSFETLAAGWELCPWSWLIDWFSNVGTMLDATNNTLDLDYDHICLMRTRRGVTTVEIDRENSDSWPAISGWWTADFTRKERHETFPLVPFPLPKLPALDAGKLSILLSLAALRR